MSRWERNDISLIDKQIYDNVDTPKIGTVTDVYEHGRPDDDSNFEADVEIDGGTVLERECAIMSPGNNAIDVPKAGDKVVILYTDEDRGKPHIIDTAWTNKDRPPVGKAGMWRRRFESGDSPAGSGDLHVSGYVEYEEEASNNAPENRGEVQASIVQIAKHADDENIIPTDGDPPAKIEMYESPTSVDDEAHIHLDANVIDADPNLGLDIFIDMKTGKLHVRGENDNDGDEYEFVLDVKQQTAKILGDSDAGNTMGASFNFDSNEFKIADGNKFGIESDGNGNFTWSHKSIDFKEESGSDGSINL